MDCPEEIENWPHNSSAWRFSYYYPLSKAMPGPVAFLYWPLLLPWHSHSTRKDLWSCNHTFIFWHRTRFCFFWGPSTSGETWKMRCHYFRLSNPQDTQVTLKEVQSLTGFAEFRLFCGWTSLGFFAPSDLSYLWDPIPIPLYTAK